MSSGKSDVVELLRQHRGGHDLRTQPGTLSPDDAEMAKKIMSRINQLAGKVVQSSNPGDRFSAAPVGTQETRLTAAIKSQPLTLDERTGRLTLALLQFGQSATNEVLLKDVAAVQQQATPVEMLASDAPPAKSPREFAALSRAGHTIRIVSYEIQLNTGARQAVGRGGRRRSGRHLMSIRPGAGNLLPPWQSRKGQRRGRPA